MTRSELQHVLIGTAGHIDHGKTRLVGRLTNIDTDRLPEEKARGISIDLGFAHWEQDGFQFGVVDVPGHERFVRNMVAGATGVNLALVVVAADDGVMPQTREHLEIMDLLGLGAGVVAITKTDLVEPEFIDLVRAEVEELTAGTFLEGCPVVPVSSATGAGLGELRETLVRVAGELRWPERRDLFRMPIDRVFSVAGHGTVVTGSVLSGEVRAGDSLVLLPAGETVRVRGVQTHRQQAEDSGARRRTAINLAAIRTEEIARGHELATPGTLRPTTRMIVELRSLPSSSLVLRDRRTLTLHMGTQEHPARVILKGKTLEPGQRAWAELRFTRPVVAAYGQRFILRRNSPALTVAGGRVIDPYIEPRRRIRDIEQHARALDQPEAAARLSVFVASQSTFEHAPLEAAWRLGIPLDRYDAVVASLKEDGSLERIGSKERPIHVHRDRLAALSRSAMRIVREELARHQPSRALPRATLYSACRGLAAQDVLEAVFQHLTAAGELVRVGQNLGPADAQVRLTKNQQAVRGTAIERIAAGGVSPPSLKELAAAAGQKADALEVLLKLSAEEGLLIPVAEGLYMTPEAIAQARTSCEELLGERGQATMSELRESWGTTRKYAVPLCEYFDRLGVTVREGDLRRAGSAAPQDS